MTRKIAAAGILIIIAAAFTSCRAYKEIKRECVQMHKKYQVHKLTEPMKIDGNWNKPQWKKVQPLDIALYMGDKPKFMPRAQAKVIYDDNFLYVIFRVEEKYVKAVETHNNGKVWEDSCVEFFVTPDGDISKGYFNFEINCIGTILNFHQTRLDVNSVPVDQSLIAAMEITPSLPKGKPIDPEIPGLTTWTMEYRVPYALLEKYHPVIKPAPGVKWRANFYKCAEANSNPHWLTWSLVRNPTPQFHLPEYFGILEFAE